MIFQVFRLIQLHPSKAIKNCRQQTLPLASTVLYYQHSTGIYNSLISTYLVASYNYQLSL